MYSDWLIHARLAIHSGCKWAYILWGTHFLETCKVFGYGQLRPLNNNSAIKHRLFISVLMYKCALRYNRPARSSPHCMWKKKCACLDENKNILKIQNIWCPKLCIRCLLVLSQRERVFSSLTAPKWLLTNIILRASIFISGKLKLLQRYYKLPLNPFGAICIVEWEVRDHIASSNKVLYWSL